MKDFKLPFELRAYDSLDKFALLATQDYNLGGKGHWFGCFRGGLYGFYARIYGVRIHYQEVHSWTLTSKAPTDTEYHLSSIFFNMDSAIECLVFAINALGYAIAPQDFLDVTDDEDLRRITPWNILGKKQLAGYANFFPELQKYWQTKQNLINTIMEQHDVSKHRSTIYIGGTSRQDAPAGFFETLGIGADSSMRFLFSPMEEIILKKEPRKPPSKQTPAASYKELQKLEPVTESFCDFINTSGIIVLKDASTHIHLSYPTFLKQEGIVYHSDIDLFEDSECMKKREGVVGIILGVELIGYGIQKGSLVPTTRLAYYQKGKRISQTNNLKKVWGETWYIDPEDGQKKFAWQNAAEFTGDQLDIEK